MKSFDCSLDLPHNKYDTIALTQSRFCNTAYENLDVDIIIDVSVHFFNMCF